MHDCDLAGLSSKDNDNTTTVLSVLTAVDAAVRAGALPARFIAAAKRLGDVLPILWNERDAVSKGKGQQPFAPVALGRCFGVMANLLAKPRIRDTHTAWRSRCKSLLLATDKHDHYDQYVHAVPNR